ncbi:MAG: Maf family protein [Longimicrobiales bacterium]|jgi:septum formation protein|nr:Maf family protein [Longimicrobiales bacterium]
MSDRLEEIRIILASQSPRRADVLRQLGIVAEVRPADVDESYRAGETPHDYVERLARTKAEAAFPRDGDALVVGGDTVVVHAGQVLGKPADEAAAVEMLVGLSGSRHQVLSGISLAGPGGVFGSVATTTVRMQRYDRDTAAAYVATGEPMDKAGGYGIQGLGAALVDSIDGDYYAVVGFPVAAFLELLADAGFRYAFGAITPNPSE